MEQLIPIGYSRRDDRTISTRHYFIDASKVGVHGRGGIVYRWSRCENRRVLAISVWFVGLRGVVDKSSLDGTDGSWFANTF